VARLLARRTLRGGTAAVNELASVGLILLLALLAGHLVKIVRVPEVTGYILAGVLVGPSGFGWITHDNLMALDVFSEVALGLILFSIGGFFELSRVRAFGMKIAAVTFTEASLAALLVGGGMLAVGQPWPVALLLGAIAMETAAASTLMVMRECNSEGPLTDTLTGIIAVNNVFCLVAFTVALSIVELSSRTTSSVAEAIGIGLFPVVWQTVGSLALGYLLGLLLASWASQVHEHGEILILLAGSVLLAVGVSNMLGLSPLSASLAVGATMVNMSVRSQALFHVLWHRSAAVCNLLRNCGCRLESGTAADARCVGSDIRGGSNGWQADRCQLGCTASEPRSYRAATTRSNDALTSRPGDRFGAGD
jgi:Kef-type K+ transport system membrane component KefB